MKTKIILATLLMLALPMTAKNEKNGNKFASQKAVLTGIWQQCLPQPTADGGIHVRFIPQYKILCGDGTFYNMAQMNPSAPAALYVSGTWSMASDSTFVEHIETIDTDTKSKGMDNELTFRLFEDNNVLGITYTMPGNGMRGKEVWMRVQKGDAVAIAQKYFERPNGIQSDGNNTLRNQQNLIIEEGQESDENLSLTENPRGIYKLMGVKGKRLVKPYFSDLYKICTDSVTMRFLINDRNPHLFRIDVPDFQVFNYTGEKTENNETDKSIRIFDSNSKRFTQKWWSTLSNHSFYPDNDWAYEYYESGNYTEASKPIFDALTMSQQPNTTHPLVGTWLFINSIDKVHGIDGKETKEIENWIKHLQKVDNWKDIIAYIRQNDEFHKNFSEYLLFTPSHLVRVIQPEEGLMASGGISKIFYNGKDSFVENNGKSRKAYWLTDDAFILETSEGYQIYERLKDDQTMLNRIGSHFVQHKE